MKRKNNLLKFIAVFVCLFCLAPVAAQAQRRKTPARKTNRPAPATASAPLNTSFETRAAATKVSVQLKNVTRFIYLLGSIAQGIEDVDNDIKARRASPAAVELNARNKASVIAALSKLRADLAPVEVEFRAKPALRNYVGQIGGITSLAGEAEEQAQAGQFKESGRTLLAVVEKLSDALLVMP
jgi:hypothetical protein